MKGAETPKSTLDLSAAYKFLTNAKPAKKINKKSDNKYIVIAKTVRNDGDWPRYKGEKW